LPEVSNPKLVAQLPISVAFTLGQKREWKRQQRKTVNKKDCKKKIEVIKER
jgi:hypothetical protein